MEKTVETKNPPKSPENNKKPWYKSCLGMGVAILFWPVFLIYFAWARSKWSQPVKIAVTVFCSIVILFGIIGVSSSPDTTTSTNQTQNTTQTTSQNTTSNTTETAPTNTTQTPTPEPAPQPKKWVTIAELSGKSSKRGDAFTLTGAKAKLVYTFKGDSYTAGFIYVVPKGQDIKTDGGFPETSVDGPQSDETFLSQSPGDYYLDVTAANASSWNVTVQEER